MTYPAPSLALPPAQLSWLPHQTPYSERFQDVYRSREGALAEVRHVFLNGCGLPGAWHTAPLFVVAENGFGTGLNFLATADIWRRTKRRDARLHYIAVEGYPLSHSELRECVERWPELRGIAQSLLRAYLHPQPGFQRLFLDGGKIVLTLLFGEALDMLRALEAHVDAWFLDGFSPEKNPEMWSTDVLAEVARLSKPGARLATYTAAGDVRRGLMAAGFDVTKAPGFGHKHEMIRAVFRGEQPLQQHMPPWFAHAPIGQNLGQSRSGHAVIIGAGLAGTHVAASLNQRGWKTTIVDQRDDIAAEASGNSVGVLQPRLTAGDNLDGRFYARAWRLALDQLEAVADKGMNIERDRCGVLQLAVAGDEDRLKAIAAHGAVPDPLMIYLPASDAANLAGCPLPGGALYFPHGGWLNPKLLCAALAADSRVVLNTVVTSVQRNHGIWDVKDARGHTIALADVVIFANAMSATTTPELNWMPLAARRGQISFVKTSPTTAKLQCVLSYGGTITPAFRGRHCIGATFDWTDDAFSTPQVTAEDHARNHADLMAALPHLGQGLELSAAQGRAGVRCTTPDHLPVAGPVPDQGAYLRAYGELRHGHPWARYEGASYQPGLYVLAGLGSRGLVSAPLAAEIVACQITGEPWPAERDVVNALHPGRFLVRDLKRLKV